jgi:regulator of RNase E activity RraA
MKSTPIMARWVLFRYVSPHKHLFTWEVALTVTIHAVPPCNLTRDEVEAWRSVPVAVAVDLARDIGQIDPAIRPLRPPGQQQALFGRAVTVLCEPPDFGAVIHALDVTQPGDVLVIAAAGNSEFAMIGEILGGYLHQRGCVGLVCDGAVRDVAALAGLPDFSVFSRFITPRGPVSATQGAVNCPIVVGGQIVQPGDLLIGDDDGLVALKPDAIRRHIASARDKLVREDEWIKNLTAGRSPLETFGLSPALRV